MVKGRNSRQLEARDCPFTSQKMAKTNSSPLYECVLSNEPRLYTYLCPIYPPPLNPLITYVVVAQTEKYEVIHATINHPYTKIANDNMPTPLQSVTRVKAQADVQQTNLNRRILPPFY